MKDNWAGIHDPYWYESTVGLTCIVKMLNPENGISAVTLQAQNINGWDDVVVDYFSGKIDYYQIKHTRSDNTITFGDLVSVKNDKSLLSYLSKCWKEVNNQADSRFIIYSNRKIGNRKSPCEVNGKSIKRPPLNDFFIEIKDQSQKYQSIDSFEINDEYRDAYNEEWLQQLQELDDNEKLFFIRQLELQVEQPDLEELEKHLTRNISKCFGITETQAVSVFESLDHALRRWTTTTGQRSRITSDDVYEALRKPAQEKAGAHDLEPPNPFFESRNPTAEELIGALKNKNYKLVFLTGSPGVGKTSLISKLNNNREHFIHLRYYTFMPISPDNDLLPTDGGRTCYSRSLWGDLLSQLRDQFKGRLSEYNVPIRNDFITDVDRLRDEVIRLSIELSKLNGERTVICIDGIDHAARAEIDRNENYLDSLLPPDNIPDEIIFIIAGQSPDAYDRYPVWLRQPNECIKCISVKNLQLHEIKIFLSKQGIEEVDWVANSVYEYTEGNTLSVLYAIETIKMCPSVAEALHKLEDYRLKDGLSIYYENIWRTSVTSGAKVGPSLPVSIAAIFSLTAAKLKPEHFAELASDCGYNREDWRTILKKFSPLIIEEKGGGYRVLHNDAKVYLTKTILSGDCETYEKIAGALIDLYLNNDSFIKQRHCELTRLLEKSNQAEKILLILSPKFVLESFIYKTPKIEIEAQIRMALYEAVRKKSIESLHNVSCCIKTLSQLENSLQEVQEDWYFNDYSQSFLNELRVLKKEIWNINLIDEVLGQILFLFRSDERNRAQGLWERWFYGLSFGELINLLPRDEIIEKNSMNASNECLSRSFAMTLGTVGRIETYLQCRVLEFNSEFELHKEAQANITTGFLEESDYITGNKAWYRVLVNCRPYFYHKDHESFLLRMLRTRNWIRIYLFLNKIKPNSLSGLFNNIGFLCALFSKNKKLIKKWKPADNEVLVSNISDERYSTDYYYNQYIAYAVTCFILGWQDRSKDVTEVVDLVASKVLSKRKENRVIIASRHLFRYSVILGQWFKEVFDERKKDNFVFIQKNQIPEIIQKLFSFQKDHLHAHIQPNDAVLFLIHIIIYCLESSGTEYQSILDGIFLNYYHDELVYSQHFELIWIYLYSKGYYDKCESLLNNIIGRSGKIWQWAIHDKFDTLETLDKITKNTQFHGMVELACENAQWYRIGFITHKDYNLYNELPWLEEIIKGCPECWKSEGLKLFSLSTLAEELGDNRARYAIVKLLMFSAMKCGLNDAYVLYQVIIKNYNYWHSFVVETIIEFFEEFHFNESLLQLIWLFCCGHIYWCEYGDRDILYRLKRAILNTQIASFNSGIAAFLKDTNPIEFEIEKLSQIKEDEYQTEKYDLDSSGEELLENYLRRNEDDFNLLKEILIRLVEARPSNFTELVHRILCHVQSREYQSWWSYRGLSKVFEVLIPLISFEQKWEIANNIVDSYYNIDNYTSFNNLSGTLESFCLFSSIENSEWLISGFTSLLEMHCNWITGFGRNSDWSLPEINLNNATTPSFKNWDECALNILLEKLDTRSGIQVEYALTAICKIIRFKPDLLQYLDECWAELSNDQQEYLLMALEPIAVLLPEKFCLLKQILEKAYESKVLSHKLQAFLVYQGYCRSSGTEGIPEVKFIPNKVLAKQHKIQSPSPRVFEIKEDDKFITNYHHLFQSRIEFLEAVSGLHIKDYLINKISYYLSHNPIKKEEEEKNSPLRNDFRISQRALGDIFNEIIEHEAAVGVFKNLPQSSIAQALITNDDPYNFLNDYQPHSKIDLWPLENGEWIKEAINVFSKILFSDLLDEIVLIGGEVRIYTSNVGMRGIFNSYLFPRSENIPEYRDVSTFNGRYSFVYLPGTFQPISPDKSFFVLCGGISKLINSINWLLPSLPLIKKFDWKFDKHNPTILRKNGEKIAWLEKFMGPLSGVGGRYDKQSAMQRWVCKKEALAVVLEDFPQFIRKENIIVENM